MNMKKIIWILETRMKSTLMYLTLFSMAILICYNIHFAKLQNNVYKQINSVKQHGKFFTFITSKFTERNGTLHLEGYFDDNPFGDVSILDIKNLTFLSERHKQQNLVSQWHKPKPTNISEHNKKNVGQTWHTEENVSSIWQKQQDLSSIRQKQQNLSSKWQKQPYLSSIRQKQQDLSSTWQKQPDLSSIRQKQQDLSSTWQKQPDLSSKWQKQQDLSSNQHKQMDLSSKWQRQNVSNAEWQKRRELILKWQREHNLISNEHHVRKPQKLKSNNNNNNNNNNKGPGKVSSCPSFNPYSTSQDLTLKTKEDFVDWQLFEQERTVKDVNCRLLFDNNIGERNRTMKLMQQPFKEVPPRVIIKKTRNCEKYIKETGYLTSSLTEEEEIFPIAYSILVFKDIQQVEQLLRTIYRPQNVYCIHSDTKANKDFRKAIQRIAGCFENVFISSRSFNVVWGTLGVLLPEITCMRDLWKHKTWKYFINLTGQEFPIRTNSELVKILKIYRGANDMESTIKRVEKARWEGLSKPPHNIRLVKGSVHIAASRRYVDYVIHSDIAKDFFNWTRGVKVPDELFFSTLNHNPQLKIPGSFKGIPETNCETKPFLARFKNWGNHIYNWPCHGKRVRLVCVLGIGDLPLLASRPEMFANKFYMQYQPYTYQCLDELIFNRTRDEYFNVLKFNTSKYEALDFIKNVI